MCVCVCVCRGGEGRDQTEGAEIQRPSGREGYWGAVTQNAVKEEGGAGREGAALCAMIKSLELCPSVSA